MSEETRCMHCGAALVADAPQGLCPACLLQRGLDSETGSHDGGSQPSTADYVAPTPAELTPHFPDLEILELLGQGGMGVVYKARQKKLNRLVALKILGGKVGPGPAFADRFAREARALAMLNHPHIVTVYDFGQAGGLYYFLMEFVDGVNLRQLLHSGKLAPKEALAIVPQICEALQYAHDKGIVHRDIKPANILLDTSGRVKIADFGVAKLMGQKPDDGLHTGEGHVMGTPHYMAPEQLEHPQEVDHRADIYSLGVVFYQMLTGELPIGRFAPPSEKVQIDVRLDEIVLRALENKPELRFQQASDIKTEIETISSTPDPALSADDDAQRQARQLVQGPAVGLLITGVLNCLVVAVIGFIVAFTTLAYAPGPATAFILLFAALLASFFFGSFVVFAALKMMRLEAYRLAITASILAILISPSSLIGLAIGIWSLVALSRAEVQAAFVPRGRTKAALRPGTAKERRLGITALAISLAAFPLALLVGTSGAWKTVLLSFFLLQLIALVCGILGRRPVAGKIAMGLSAMTLVLGTATMFLILKAQFHRDFGGMPTLERLDAGAGKPSGNREKTTAIEQAVANGGTSTKARPTATPALLAERPQLRFLAWQDEWTTNQPRGAFHTDGSAATDPSELRLLSSIRPTVCDASGTAEGKSHPRFLHLWFSHPLIDEQSLIEVRLLDSAGKPVPLGGGGLTGSNVRELDGNDHLGWLTYTLSPGDGANVPASVMVRLRYTLGPWKEQRQFAPDKNEIVALGNGSQFNAVGQNLAGNAFFSFAVDMKQDTARQFGVVAVTKDGRELQSSGGQSGGGNGEAVHVQRFVFAAALADIAHFRLGTRAFRTVEFQNVVLQPKPPSEK